VARHSDGGLTVGQATRSYAGTLVERTICDLMLLRLPPGVSPATAGKRGFDVALCVAQAVMKLAEEVVVQVA